MFIGLIKRLLSFKILKKYLPAVNIGDALKGDNVFCICCNENFITFLPFGLVKRANALCPRCGSLERHRLHWSFMVNKTNLLKRDVRLKILHVAPEIVFFDKFNSNPNFDYVPCAKFGVDYTDKYPSNTINVDITQIQFDDNSFDVIYCSHVLEHVPDDIKALREFYRVLKPGGWAMLQVPIDKSLAVTYEDLSIVDPAERETAFGQYDHVRVYGVDYIERLIKAGFLVDKNNYIGSFTQNEIFYNGFQNGEDIFICTKI